MTGIISVSNSSASLGTMLFSNANNVSWGINGQTITASAAGGGAFSGGMSTNGNTSGDTGLVTGRLVLIGGNNITLSGSSNGGSLSLTISGANAGGAQTGISGIVASNTTYTSGTVSFSAQNNITIGSSVNGATQYIRLSVGNYITTARASTDAVGLNTAQTNVTWTVNSSGISLNAGGYAGTGITTTTTAGTAIVGTNNTVGLSLGVPAYITTADLSQNSSNYFRNWKLTGNTAGTTSSQQGTDLWLAGGNGITVSGSSNTISISAANQSNQTEGRYLSGNTTADQSSFTFDARTLSISAAGNLSIGYNTAASQLVISGATAAAGSLSFYASSNTTGTSSGTGAGSISIAGAGAVSVAASNSGFVVSAPATSSLSATGWASLSTNGSTISIGASTTMNVYASSNTFGTSSGTVDLRTISIAGSGNCSIAASNSGWVVSVPAQTNQTGNVYASSNTFGTSSGTYDARTLSIAGSGAVSVAASNSGWVVYAPPRATLSYYENMNRLDAASTTINNSGSSLWVQPFIMPQAISLSYIRVPVSMSAITTAAGTPVVNSTFSGARGQTDYVVIYTQGVGASSRSIQYLTSGSAGWSFITNVGAGAQSSRYTVTLSVSYPLSGNNTNLYTTQWAVSSASINASSESYTLFTGPKMVDIPCAFSLSAGNYWIAFGRSTATSTQSANIGAVTNASIGFSTIGISQSNISWGVPGNATSASDNQLKPGLGIWTTNSLVGSTSSIALSQVSNVASNPVMAFSMIRQA